MNSEKIKTKKLSSENNDLKQQIVQLKSKLNSQNNNINISNNENNSINLMINLLKEKEDIIKDLNDKLKRYPFILEKDEKIISIIFSSMDQQVNYSLICKNTDTINRIE